MFFFTQDIQVGTVNCQDRLSDMSFRRPNVMAIHRIYLCVRPCCWRLFGLGIYARSDIYCACKYCHPSGVWTLIPWRYSRSPLSVGLCCTKKSVLVIDPCSGLLLSRTWVFTGRKKLIAWVFSILFISYFASNLWANINFMELYKGPHDRPSPEVCLRRLTVARHRTGVGVDNLTPFISTKYNYLLSLFK